MNTKYKEKAIPLIAVDQATGSISKIIYRIHSNS